MLFVDQMSFFRVPCNQPASLPTPLTADVADGIANGSVKVCYLLRLGSTELPNTLESPYFDKASFKIELFVSFRKEYKNQLNSGNCSSIRSSITSSSSSSSSSYSSNSSSSNNNSKIHWRRYLEFMAYLQTALVTRDINASRLD